MAINKVVYGNDTLMDITDTTAAASDVASGEVFYTASGTRSIGTADYLEELTILSYGKSTWSDFITAYNKKCVVYCRASSNSNPASGSQTRLAFMAYVNNAETPTEVEFQYYRSVSSHSASQQGDQVYVYKLNKTNGWSVTVREAYTKIVAGTGLSSSYSSGTLTLTGGTPTDVKINNTSITSGGVANIATNSAYDASSNKIATMTDLSGYVNKSTSSSYSTGLTGWDYEGDIFYETRLQGGSNEGFINVKKDQANILVSQESSSEAIRSAISFTPNSIWISTTDLNAENSAYISLEQENNGDKNITLGGSQVNLRSSYVPDNNNSVVNKKYVDDIVGDIETLLGGI